MQNEAGNLTTGIIDLTDSANVDEGENEPSASGGDARPKEPRKQFTWTGEMRDVFGELWENKDKMVSLYARGMYVIRRIDLKNWEVEIADAVCVIASLASRKSRS
jgi:hypothetical protein